MSMTLKNWLCFCCCSKTMGFKKALPFVLKLIVLTLLVLLPFVQPSSSNGIYGTNMVGSRPMTTSSIEIEVARVVNEEAASVGSGTVEESARLVPTGPDPLHNNNPIRP